MVAINPHMFKDREPLKDYLGNRLSFYGIPIEYRNIRNTISEVVVSVYCPDHHLEFDHLVLDLLFRQAARIKLFTPISFTGIVERYQAPKMIMIDSNNSMSVMSDTYGIKKVRDVKLFNEKLPDELSKWCLRIIRQYDLDYKKVKELPSDGNREKFLFEIDKQMKRKRLNQRGDD